MVKDKFSFLFKSMIEGVALHRYVRDSKGKIINYIIEDVNPSFEKILNIKKEKIIGKLASEAYSVSEAPYLKEYSSIKEGEPLRFEVYFEPLKKYFFISASPWSEDGFATIFFDISDRKKIEKELKEKNDNLEKVNNLMIDRELRMIELKDDIKKLKK